MEVEFYNGFRIVPVLVFETHINEISGHSWRFCKGEDLHKVIIEKLGEDKCIYKREHSSIKKAKIEIDLCNKFPFKAY